MADFDVSDSIEAGHLRVSADFAEPEKIEFFEEQIRANSTPQTGNYFSFIAAKKETKNQKSQKRIFNLLEIREFVHERVFHRFGHALVDCVLPLRAEEVLLFDVVRVLALGDPHHPQEFVNIVAGISEQAAENH